MAKRMKQHIKPPNFETLHGCAQVKDRALVATCIMQHIKPLCPKPQILHHKHHPKHQTGSR